MSLIGKVGSEKKEEKSGKPRQEKLSRDIKIFVWLTKLSISNAVTSKTQIMNLILYQILKIAI